MNDPAFRTRALSALLYGGLTVAVLMCLAGEYGYAAFVVAVLAAAFAGAQGRDGIHREEERERDAPGSAQPFE